MDLPIQAADGNVFQFDRNSRDLLKGGITALNSGVVPSIDWRLLDNATVTCTAAQLQSYLTELETAQAIRALLIDVNYQNFKTNGATKRDLRTWAESYLT